MLRVLAVSTSTARGGERKWTPASMCPTEIVWSLPGVPASLKAATIKPLELFLGAALTPLLLALYQPCYLGLLDLS